MINPFSEITEDSSYLVDLSLSHPKDIWKALKFFFVKEPLQGSIRLASSENRLRWRIKGGVF